MGSEGISLISEERLRKNQYVHIPEEIHEIFYSEQIENNNTATQRSSDGKDESGILYHWCYDSKADLILATPYQLRDLNSEWHAHTEWDPEGQRVRFPKDATEALNVSVGDKLFFVARDDVESLPVPTIYVLNAEKAEEVMLQRDDVVLNILDRQPNFS